MILIPMTQFILDIDSMAADDFCRTYNVNLPSVGGGVKYSFRIDVAKYQMIVDYAKILDMDISVDVLTTKLGFTEIGDVFGRRRFGKDRYVIAEDEYGFHLEPYDSMDDRRISKIDDLTDLGISWYGNIKV